MDKTKKAELLADIFDVEPEEIKEDMELGEVGDWDSLAILSFIVMMGEEFHKAVSGDQVKKLITVADAFEMME